MFPGFTGDLSEKTKKFSSNVKAVGLRLMYCLMMANGQYNSFSILNLPCLPIDAVVGMLVIFIHCGLSPLLCVLDDKSMKRILFLFVAMCVFLTVIT